MIASADAQAIAAVVLRLSHCVLGTGYQQGLSPAQWGALRYFANANRFSRSLSAFACYQGTTRGTASQTVKSLVEKSLLSCRTDAKDRRKNSLEITRRGRSLLNRDPIRKLMESTGRLNGAERRAVWTALEKMLGGIVADLELPCFGFCGHCRHLRTNTGGGTEYHCELLDETLYTEDLEGICVNYDAPKER